jgi:hypothetical protein
MSLGGCAQCFISRSIPLLAVDHTLNPAIARDTLHLTEAGYRRLDKDRITAIKSVGWVWFKLQHRHFVPYGSMRISAYKSAAIYAQSHDDAYSAY